MVVINLPGVIAGGGSSPKEHLGVPVWERKFQHYIFFFGALGSSVPVCRGSSCLLDVFVRWMNCIHLSITYVDAFVCVHAN